ncbi:MBL fold metallo-hydrolase [Buchananella felis]|uniref:MBL fold metallo-hydrolase n=1 Tax=Buchananella felis TaxID=3231492 RepID=UPI0035285707
MLLSRIVSPVFGANCFIYATGRGGSAVVIDPGAHTAAPVAAELERLELTLEAVIATHGHPDHVWDCAAVAGDKPVYVPGPDMYRMEDPDALLGPLAGIFTQQAGAPWQKPANLVEFPAQWFAGGGQLAGLPFVAVAAPGHSEGSTFLLSAGELEPTGLSSPDGAELAGAAEFAFGGDVIFAGSVGRTDLPGSDERQMLSTLRTLQQVINPQTWVLPGHGPLTRMRIEAATNPHLKYAARVG